MSLLSAPLGARAREGQFIGDLATLFRRYRVRTGTPDCLEALAPQLEANDSLRSDLFALCSAISRMSESDLDAEELLPFVAKAVGGPRASATPAGWPSDFSDVFTNGFRQWQARIDSLPEFSFEAPKQDAATGKANKFAAAADMSSRDATVVPATANGREEIAPHTPIGELTISELRSYLEEIEQRVGRIQPYLKFLRGPAIPEPLTWDDVELADSLRVHSAAGPSVQPTAGSRITAEAGSPAPEWPVIQPSPAFDEPVPRHVTIPAKPASASRPEQPAAPSTAATVGTDRQINGLPQQANNDQVVCEGEVPEPYIFRSLAEPQRRNSHLLLWVAATLALLAPATYYGRRIIAPPPPRERIGPAATPALSPEGRADGHFTAQTEPALSTPPAPPPATNTRVRLPGAAGRLKPRAVHMAVEAARAEEQSNGARR